MMGRQGAVCHSRKLNKISWAGAMMILLPPCLFSLCGLRIYDFCLFYKSYDLEMFAFNYANRLEQGAGLENHFLLV
jgi:hypothetical protein